MSDVDEKPAGPRRDAITQGWESYRNLVIPPDAGEVQVQETRRGFYAGAWVLLQVVRQLGESEVPEEVGVEVLESIAKELEAFHARVGKGT